MKFRKIPALLLSLSLMIVVFAGCSQTPKSPFVSEEPAVTESPTPDVSATTDVTASPSALNFDGAYASLEPNTVMLTANESVVTWAEMFYFINYAIYELEESQGYQISDMSAIFQDGITYKDYILDTATGFALQYAALQYGAEQLEVTLSETDKAAIQASWDERVTSAGSEEAFMTELQALYCSKDFFMDLIGYSYLAQGCFASMYGADGSELSDEEAADNTAQDGYLMAKHILIPTTKTDEAGNETPLSDTEKADVLVQMEDILSQLKNYNGDDFDIFFDELMNKFSQDPGGLARFPDGYLFQDGNMVPEFYDGTNALGIGEFSDIIESEFGYHIIYRIPINYDITPMGYADYGNYSLRLLTAQNMFGAIIDTWLNSQNVIYTEEYNSLDLAKIFAVG